MNALLKNPLTTIGGILASIGAFLMNSDDPLMKMIGTIFVAVGTFLMGGAAADAKNAAKDGK